MLQGQAYFLRSALENRNRLVTEHQRLVPPIARGLLRRLPPSFDLADLVQAGTVGLIQAAEAFAPGRGVPFSIYAKQRIRGAILDSTRRRAWRESSHDELPDVPDLAPAPDELAFSREMEARVRGALLLLPLRDRRVLVLHVLEDLPLRAAGRQVNVSKTRAAQLVRRALRTLRRELAG